jgi:hypothetical protein
VSISYCTYCTDYLSGYCRSSTLYKREAILSLPQPPFPVDSTSQQTWSFARQQHLCREELC